MSLRKKIKKNILVIDGAMGTSIQNSGVKIPLFPEELNITNPDVINKIHSDFVETGANIITTNSFGLNKFKAKQSKYSVDELVKASIDLVKLSKAQYVAFDIGPSGKLIEPIGKTTFDELYECYKELVISATLHGADLFIIETFNDLYELKTAILAVKENSDLPVISFMTFDETGHTLSGTDVLCFVNLAASLGVDALGVNCSLGPVEMESIVTDLVKYSPVPVALQPNRGLPKIDDLGNTYYDLEIPTFTKAMLKYKDMGVSILGGCCGTNNLFIKDLVNSITDFTYKREFPVLGPIVSSYSKSVDLDEGIKLIGERINPTGKKLLKQALLDNNLNYVLKETVNQVNEGADILDVNVGIPGIDEEKVMVDVIKSIQTITNIPLQIDSTTPSVIEKACRYYNGRMIINSVNGELKSIESILPIVKKYGCLVIGLTLDEKGIPKDSKTRVDIASNIIESGIKLGINENQFIIDCLTLTVSAEQSQVYETLYALREIKSKYNVKTTLGASNISFGLPNRVLINTVFLNMAFAYGLDVPIVNTGIKSVMDMLGAYRVLNGEDKLGIKYINAFKNAGKVVEVLPDNKKSLYDLLTSGLKEDALNYCKKSLETEKGIDIINGKIIPVLFKVGELFEEKKIFLPELIQAADSSGYCLDYIKDIIKSNSEVIEFKGKIVIATVMGDVHDIGKNITKVLLENNGYYMVDLGKDISSSSIIEVMKKQDIRLVGLSALMTTTVKNMEQTIKDIREVFNDATIVVGGAVLTEKYSKKIDADFYAKDAQAAVKIFNSITSK